MIILSKYMDHKRPESTATVTPLPSSGLSIEAMLYPFLNSSGTQASIELREVIFSGDKNIEKQSYICIKK